MAFRLSAAFVWYRFCFEGAKPTVGSPFGGRYVDVLFEIG